MYISTSQLVCMADVQNLISHLCVPGWQALRNLMYLYVASRSGGGRSCCHKVRYRDSDGVEGWMSTRHDCHCSLLGTRERALLGWVHCTSSSSFALTVSYLIRSFPQECPVRARLCRLSNVQRMACPEDDMFGRMCARAMRFARHNKLLTRQECTIILTLLEVNSCQHASDQDMRILQMCFHAWDFLSLCQFEIAQRLAATGAHIFDGPKQDDQQRIL